MAEHDPAPNEDANHNAPRPQTSSDSAAGEDTGASDASQRLATLSPFPDHRDLYLIIAGVVLGVLMGGAVLGNIAPSLYQRLFVGGQDALSQLQQRRAEQADKLKRLRGTDVSQTRLNERIAAFERELVPLKGRYEKAVREHEQWLAGRMTALVLALAGVMVLEVLAGPQLGAGRRVTVPRALNRLITIRYALIALWLALVIAQPRLLSQLPVLFTAMVLAVALIVAFIPLGRRAPEAAA